MVAPVPARGHSRVVARVGGTGEVPLISKELGTTGEQHITSMCILAAEYFDFTTSNTVMQIQNKCQGQQEIERP